MKTREKLRLMLAASLCCGQAHAATLQTLLGMKPSLGWPATTLALVGGGNKVFPAGSLVGTAQGGGVANRGTVFALVPPAAQGSGWTPYVLHSFAGKFDGAGPNAPVTVLKSGIVVSSTMNGGPWWSGTYQALLPKFPNADFSGAAAPFGADGVAPTIPPVLDFLTCLFIYEYAAFASPDEFPLVKQFKFCYAYSFSTPAKRNEAAPTSTQVLLGYPPASPVSDGGHGYYVTAAASNPQGGAIADLTPPATTKNTPWTTTILHLFGQASGDLVSPAGPVYRGPKGVLYGAATGGGAHNAGGIYALAPPAEGQTAWTETILWSFGGTGDGIGPNGDLIIEPNGTMFGTTRAGGTAGAGTVFKLAPPAKGQSDWQETLLHSFLSTKDAQYPVGALYRDSSGNLYGAATQGGTNYDGAIYMLSKPPAGSTTWTESFLWNFTGGVDGAAPLGGLIGDGNGNIYGTTSKGGTAGSLGRYPNGYGTVFMLTP